MKKYLEKYKFETLIIFILFIFSLLNISKGYLLKKEYSSFLNKQIMWITIGIILYILIYKINIKKIFKLRFILYAINVLLLLYVLLFSKSINNVKAWINIKGFTLQPSEFIKITYPFCAIKEINNKKSILPTILFLIPFTLILLEPDTGNAVLLLLIYLYLIINKNNKKYIYGVLFIFASLFLILLYTFNHKEKILINIFHGKLYYRFKRIIDFKNNYQVNNALIGIGNAKAFPISLKNIIIYIPEGLTDFMFSFHICNFGYVLGFFIIFLYYSFIYLNIKKYQKEKYKFKKKLIGSFLTVFIIQIIYNIFMNIGLLPIMGIPMPLVSYGGSNIISYLIFYSLINKKISSIEDKDNNNYKNSFHKVLVDKNIHSYN